MQKENPNPTIHTTADKRSKRSHSSASSKLLGSAAIHRYNLGSPSPSKSHIISPAHEYYDGDAFEDAVGASYDYQSRLISAEERSVALALSAAAYPSTNPSTQSTDDDASTKLNILQHAGFALFHPQRIQKQCKALRFPSFSPFTQYEEQKSIDQAEMKREAITSEEVFDIIRNIQDPEHPLTLEQLNVVRLELIDVVDLKGGDPDDVCSNDKNGRTLKKFSTVHVQFT